MIIPRAIQSIFCFFFMALLSGMSITTFAEWQPTVVLEAPHAYRLSSPTLVMNDSGSAACIFNDQEVIQGARIDLNAHLSTYKSGKWIKGIPVCSWLISKAVLNSHPQIVSDNMGNIIALWQTYEAPYYKLLSASYSSGYWSVPVILDESLGKIGIHQMALDKSSGKALAVWSSPTDKTLKASFFSAGSWNYSMVIANEQVASNLSASMAGGASAIVAWSCIDEIRGQEAIYVLQNSMGSNNGWQSTSTLLFCSDESLGDLFTGIDVRGRSLVLWQSQMQGFGRICSCLGSMQGGWSSPSILSRPSDDARILSFSMDPTGAMFAMWTHGKDGSDAAMALARSEDGVVWSREDFTSQHAVSSPVITTNGSQAIAAWIELQPSANIIQSTYFDSGRWKPIISLATHVDDTSDLDVVMDSNGRGFAAWISMEYPGLYAPQVKEFHALIPQTINFPELANHVYGDNSFTLGAHASSGLAIQYAISGPARLDGNTLTITGSGTVTVTATQEGNYIYKAAPAVNRSFNVDRAILKVTATAKNGKYGSSIPALTYTVTGLKNNDSAQNVLQGSLSTIAGPSSGYGKYQITQGTLSLNHNYFNGLSTVDYSQCYNLVFKSAMLTQYKATLVVSPNNQNMVYGSSVPYLKYMVSGLQNGDLASNVLQGDLSSAVSSASPSGKYPIVQGSLALNTDYEMHGELVDYSERYILTVKPSMVVTVYKAPLVVTPDSYNTTYGASAYSLTYTVTGLQNNDAVDLVLQGSLATTAQPQSPSGKYPITQGSLTLNSSVSTPQGVIDYSQCYTLSVKKSMMVTIYPAKLLIIPDSVVMTYGDPVPELTYQVRGLQNADDCTCVLSGNLFTSAASNSGGGSYDITRGTVALNQASPLDGGGSLDYTQCYFLSFVKGVVVVNPANITAVADPKILTYGMDVPALTYRVLGLRNNDEISSVLSGSPSTSATLRKTCGVYPINQGTLSLQTNASVGNRIIDYSRCYTMTFQRSLCKINPCTLQVIAQPKNMVYGNIPPSFDSPVCGVDYVINGFVNNDSISIVTGVPELLITGIQSSTPVGVYDITATPGSLLAPNYNFTMVDASLTIKPAVLKVSACEKNMVYGDIPPNMTQPVYGVDYTVDGFTEGDVASMVTGAPILTSNVDITSHSGVYDIGVDVSKMSAMNYVFMGINGFLNVAKEAQSIKWKDTGPQTYGSTLDLNDLASASSGLGINYCVVSGPASLKGSMLTFTGVGSVAIVATQPGNEDYTSAPSVTHTIHAAPAVLTVNAGHYVKVYGDPNPNFSCIITGYCLEDDIKLVTGSAILSTRASNDSNPGSYDIDINTLGMSAANYTFQGVKGNLLIEPAHQTLTFSNIPDQVYGSKLLLDSFASASSGLAVVFDLISGPAMIQGSIIHFTGVGNVVVQASQPGNVSYKPSAPSVQTVRVVPAVLKVKALDQFRDYGVANPKFTYVIGGYVEGDDGGVIAGVPIFSSQATLSSDPGQYAISVDVLGMRAVNYTFAGVSGILTVGKKKQAIYFSHITDQVYGGTLNLSNLAEATSGLDINYSVVSGPASLKGSTVTFTGVGHVVIMANQEGNADYNAAPSISQSITVGPATLTVAASPCSRVYGYPTSRPYGFLDPIFPYTITGYQFNESNVVITGVPSVFCSATFESPVGSYEIQVDTSPMFATNYIFQSVNSKLVITKATQKISFNAIPAQTYKGKLNLKGFAKASSGLNVNYTVISGPATLSETMLTFTDSGSVVIAASQPGNGNYLAAPVVTQTFMVTPFK